jgi:phosphatidylinositol kinase/protein kinase (PI-3  family)
MISPSGHFFHVDFGYILGRDPKPFPPSIKVCKEMVDGMGGDKSSHYGRFKRLCYTAFICLRKNSGLIINLVGLMIEANIPDIKLEPDKAVMKVCFTHSVCFFFRLLTSNEFFFSLSSSILALSYSSILIGSRKI